ncbi:4Fe-4S dicluster domain-containing protein [Alkalimonas amylolytica]|uniref:4Fe-4S dicluster domain-containing protein n=1 Tax=Alkalimonas amylolytica TaxID=152573 RepID=A0A1H3ZI40_ALKAM|nr:4Fe-4S dicluster domain-containing protein [Alkalimonas amylolytica]SEA23228.1 4Fe-4S dicluster domain-containing protein [Alkalimonas amylolytica]
MTAVIEVSCINCDMCVPECPNQAIVMGAQHYEVVPALCTECEGYYDVPTCIAVCPIDCIYLMDAVREV